MRKKCKDCQKFFVTYDKGEELVSQESGIAKCVKYMLFVEFKKKEFLDGLECVEDDGEGDNK